MSVYVLADMTYPEVQHALSTIDLAIIPIGAHEQHGPHLTENCDAVIAEKMAIRLGERLYPHAVVAPTINMGVSSHHLNFPGTIALQPSTLISLIHDIVYSLKQHGITQFLLLNAHGGNQSTLSVASTELSQKLGVKIYFAKTTGSAKHSIQRHIHSPLFGHSCEREVSEALYLAPSIVRLDKLQKGAIKEGTWKYLRPNSPVQGPYQYEEMTANGCIGDATQSREDIGREIVEEALENLELTLKDIIGTTIKA
ncbi:creatininase family protein [Fictibacillus terranigra]|uniref:Creatininase family protein n=1 Tax=Fictibacillus terranigra TaxID=3058424 RepID=A0ABT8EDM4_9BACL|nr:creatininase family protein [Fictibacillus sp. CENA-BCM004]MDN4076043.1 creatininase family protein [Fictibacillus sp. CENA-BCM004]